MKCSETENYLKPNKLATHQMKLGGQTRLNCCPYCLRAVTNFSRHIMKFHKTEEEVRSYMSILDDDLKVRKKRDVF